MNHTTKMVLKHQNSIYVNDPKKKILRNDFRIPTPPKKKIPRQGWYKYLYMLRKYGIFNNMTLDSDPFANKFEASQSRSVGSRRSILILHGMSTYVTSEWKCWGHWKKNVTIHWYQFWRNLLLTSLSTYSISILVLQFYVISSKGLNQWIHKSHIIARHRI